MRIDVWINARDKSRTDRARWVAFSDTLTMSNDSQPMTLCLPCSFDEYAEHLYGDTWLRSNDLLLSKLRYSAVIIPYLLEYFLTVLTK